MNFYDHGHVYIYSEAELSGLMKEIGYVDVTVTKAGQPANAIFNGVEGHAGMSGAFVNEYESLALEARKAPA